MPLQQQSLLCLLTQGKKPLQHCWYTDETQTWEPDGMPAKWRLSQHPKWSVSGFILWISWEAAMRIKSLWTPYPWADGVSRVAGKQRTICTSKDPEASELWNVPSICIKTTFFWVRLWCLKPWKLQFWSPVQKNRIKYVASGVVLYLYNYLQQIFHGNFAGKIFVDNEE